MNKDIRFSFLTYMNTFVMYGYPKILKSSETAVWMVLVNYLADLVEGIEISNIQENYFYIDYAYGTDKAAKELGVSRKTLSTVIANLKELGLIEVDKGEENAGISRLYFPITIPKPSGYTLPKFFVDRYSDKANEKVSKREKAQKMISEGKKPKDYSKEKIDDYTLSVDDDQQSKRVKVQAQYIILLSKLGADVSDRKFQSAERGKITKLISVFGNPFLVERVVKEMYFNEKITLDNVYGAIYIRLYELKPDAKKITKEYRAKLEKVLEEKRKEEEKQNELFFKDKPQPAVVITPKVEEKKDWRQDIFGF